MEEWQDGETNMTEASLQTVSNGIRSSIDTVHEKRRQAFSQGNQPMLTITTEKIERVMVDVQTEIDGLQHYLINLGLAKTRVAILHAKGWKGPDQVGLTLIDDCHVPNISTASLASTPECPAGASSSFGIL